GIWVTGDGDATAIAGKHIVVRESQSGDIDTIHVKKLHNGNTIWISKDDDNDDKVWVGKEDDGNVFEFDHDDGDKFFMSLDDGKEPLFMLNGKEISKKEMDDLDPDSIEKIEVLKGGSATEKYGEKGKDGVVLITTKDKK
ncbi:MAG TPA: TonB-dependent receptor plug domain-containing protein, partial [Flavobacteriaceae bacterium]|nr:TonB-dependent receptor plug domain-containing protein [Flavobacteriaceae bacterium]